MNYRTQIWCERNERQRRKGNHNSKRRQTYTDRERENNLKKSLKKIYQISILSITTTFAKSHRNRAWEKSWGNQAKTTNQPNRRMDIQTFFKRHHTQISRLRDNNFRKEPRVDTIFSYHNTNHVINDTHSIRLRLFNLFTYFSHHQGDRQKKNIYMRTKKNNL